MCFNNKAELHCSMHVQLSNIHFSNLSLITLMHKVFASDDFRSHIIQHFATRNSWTQELTKVFWQGSSWRMQITVALTQSSVYDQTDRLTHVRSTTNDSFRYSLPQLHFSAMLSVSLSSLCESTLTSNLMSVIVAKQLQPYQTSHHSPSHPKRKCHSRWALKKNKDSLFLEILGKYILVFL